MFQHFRLNNGYRLNTKKAVVLTFSFTLCAFGLTPAWAENKPDVPFQYGLGLEKYHSLCAECHGRWAEGTDKGPTLIHPYYVPSHHSDQSFYRAILQGAPMHHWDFGDMPPVEGANEQDALNVTAFVRWLQQYRGLYQND